MLSEHRIQVVEFEYNSRVGYWHPRFQERRTLNTSLGLLGAAGYECFWEGNDGRLALAGGEAWCSMHKNTRWSNLVCSCVQPIVAVLRTLQRQY